MTKAPLSSYIEKNGFIFTSGQIHLKDGFLVEGSATEQTHQVMKNLENVLKTAGADFKDVMKATIYVTDMAIYAELNEVYASYFENVYPAREVIGVKALPLGARIEISLVAVKSK